MSVAKDFFCYIVASCFPFYGSGKYSLRGDAFSSLRRVVLVSAKINIRLRGGENFSLCWFGKF